jgi:glycosyltransferase involved in cell wall biosynthesis
MSQSDFERYNCDACEGLMGEGNELLAQIRNWTSKSVVLFEEGFEEAEFLPLRPRAVVCPSCILVIGSESLRKGFGDFIDALRLFEKRRPDFLGWECHLTGSRTARFAAMLSQTMRSKFTFLGRREDFSELVRQYDFAVHPSRAETFGMAPIESMLAGTPTLISETGIVSELVLPPAWTFPPADVETLSRRLEFLWEFWPPLDFSHVHAQVRNRCHINHTASVVRAEIETIVNRLK